jgi:outer membrane protein OmpA-like peptidoglycan-associated protein
MWVIMMALASCTDLAGDRGPGEAAAEPSDYPSLHTVPPRPQLSYTVEQRRAIMDGLIADRENARYSDQVVRYRAGLSGLPPPAEPPVAAAPPAPAPDRSGTGDAAAPAGAAPERPVVGSEDQFLDEDEDDFETFLGDMTRDRRGEPGAVAPGPESNAAPLAPTIVRAGAVRPVSAPQTDYGGRPPGVVWAIPVKTAGAPEAPRPKAAPAAASSAVAGRAPGVVWGMARRSGRPVAVGAAGTSVAPADQRRDSAPAPAVPRTPAAPPAAAGNPAPAGPTAPTGTAVAGRAPGVVWGMVELPAKPAAPAAAESGAPVADATAPAPAPLFPTPAVAAPVQTSGQDGTIERSENGAGPAAAVVAERSDRSPPPELQAAAGIEVGDGLIALAPASGTGPAPAAAAIAFAPGSATLPPDADARLERFLAEVKAPDARIRVVGAAATPALALDRALAVGLALVRRGIPADRLDMTLAQDAASDQARLSLASPAP